MTCRWRNQDSDTLLQCMALMPIFAEADVSTYASRVGADGPDGPYGYVYWYAVSCLRINRLIRPNIPEGPCSKLSVGGHNSGIAAGGTIARVSVSAGASTAASIGAAGLTFGLSLAALAIGPLVHFFQGLSGAPSAQELAIQCQVVATWNQFADQLEQVLAAGKIGIQDATLQYKQLHDELVRQLQQWTQRDFAPYSLTKAIDALFIFNNEVVLPNITTARPDSASVPVLAVGGIFAAKLFGVF